TFIPLYLSIQATPLPSYPYIPIYLYPKTSVPEIIIQARKASIAPGMEVKRILPFRKRRMVGPFIFMDHAGPVAVQPEEASNMDVLPHPHIGLSTVSYLFGGQVTHRDS